MNAVIVPINKSVVVVHDRFAEYQQKVEGTNIDSRSLLSTDYFNHFNTVIMLLSMLPDMPDMLEEIDQWKYISYVEHFQASGLDFAPVAIEAYEFGPTKLRTRFERKVQDITSFVELSRLALRQVYDSGDKDRFAELAIRTSRDLQNMVDEGGGIVHGYEESLDQSSIDNLFP
jgi:hypothetical protein